MTGKQSINVNGKKIKVNFDGFNNTITMFQTNAENLKNGNSYISSMIEDLRAQFSVDTFINIDEVLGGLKININQIYEQLMLLNGKIKETKSYYEDLYNKYGVKDGEASFEEEVEKSYKKGTDGYSITQDIGTLTINGKTYKTVFHDKWISDAAANDPELRNYLNKYGTAASAAAAHGDGYASLGSSRAEAVSNLESAEKQLQEYISKNYGDKGFQTSFQSSSSNSNASTGSSNSSAGSSSGTGLWNDAVNNSYNPKNDGYTITTGSGRALGVNNDTYYNYFGSDTGDGWISDAAANDPTLRTYLNNYGSAYEGLKSHGDGWASFGDSRSEWVANLQNAEAELQSYLSENGYPSLRTKA